MEPETGIIRTFAIFFLEFLSVLITLVVAALIIFVIYIYIVDRFQSKQTIRRNYPVLGRFRYAFEHMGEFFRQYFFALDRDELPFNRAQRAWAYRAAKNEDSTVAFGSTRPLNSPGDIVFLNCIFPTLTEDVALPAPVTIGEGYAEKPYTTSRLFHVSGMSFGAISSPAVTALSHGAKTAGIWMNTGEGGLSPYHLKGACDIVFQVGTAKYGVRTKEGLLSDDKLREVAAHDVVKMFEIKMSQGAKPGKGGILPAEKVSAEISAIRGIEKGVASISPNGHPDIRSVDDLLDRISHIRKVTGKPCGFKCVIGKTDWLDDLFKAIHRRGLQDAPDFMTIDSADGGTGAAPQSLMDYVGQPIRRSLPLVVDMLISYGLRDRIKVIASGKLINPSDVAWALCIGADFIVSARGFMFSLGCIQALQCNKNTCPTGIATHRPDLQQGLVPREKSQRVFKFSQNMEYEVGLIAHACGVKEARQLKREHAQMINQVGLPEVLENVYPIPKVKEEYVNFVAKDQIKAVNTNPAKPKGPLTTV